jgi:intracellular multiplication protein IcmE
MSQQMESVLSNQPIKGPIVQPVASLSYLEALEEKERRQLEEALAAQQAQLALATGNTAIDDLNIILPAGTIEYAQMLTEANTDAPGPILAQIVTGPLKGARVVGSFTSTYNYLVLSFNTIILDGVDFSANGVAIDPNTTLPGMVTEIDRRYMQRVILPASAAFVTGLTRAIADSGKTTIVIRNSDGSSSTTTSGTNSGDQEIASGIKEAGDEISDLIDEVADNIEPMLRVAAGTPLGILFVDPVIATPKLIQQQQLQEPSPGVTLPLGTDNLLQNTNNLLPAQ